MEACAGVTEMPGSVGRLPHVVLEYVVMVWTLVKWWVRQKDPVGRKM